MEERETWISVRERKLRGREREERTEVGAVKHEELVWDEEGDEDEDDPESERETTAKRGELGQVE